MLFFIYTKGIAENFQRNLKRFKDIIQYSKALTILSLKDLVNKNMSRLFDLFFLSILNVSILPATYREYISIIKNNG